MTSASQEGALATAVGDGRREPLGAAVWIVISVATLVGIVLAVQGGAPGGEAENYAYVRDLLANGFVPALTASYNGTISFPAPFLALELVALLSAVTRIDPLAVLQLLPPLLIGLSMVAFAWLARELLVGRRLVVVATVLYASMTVGQPAIATSDVVTAVVLLVGIVALQVGTRAFRTGRRRSYVLAGALIGLAQLAHPLGGVACGIGLVAVLVLVVPTRARLTGLLAMGVIALLVSAPWWLRVGLELGLGPFLSVVRRDDPLLPGMVDQLPWLAWSVAPLLLAPAVGIGLLETIVHPTRRLLALGAWVVVLLLVDLRDPAMLLPVPIALFAAAGLASFGTRTWPALVGVGSEGPPRAPVLARLGGLAVAAIALAIPFVLPGFATPRDRLGPADRASMLAASEQLGPDTRYLVVTGSGWDADAISEWFPALTRAVSVATPEGAEWLGTGVLRQAVDDHAAAQACAGQTAGCIDAWTAATHLPFDAVYVAGPAAASSADRPRTIAGHLGIAPADAADCCAPLRASLATDPAWRVVYDGPGAMIAVRSGPPPVPATTRPFAGPVTTRTVDVPPTIDATGASDVSAALNAFVASVPDGSTIVFPEGASYRLDPGGLVLYDRHHLVLDGNGATLRVTSPGDTWLGGPINLDSQRTTFGLNSHIAIRDFNLVGSNANTTTVHTPGAGQNQYGVGIWGGSFIEISGNRISRTFGDGVYVSGNDDTHASADSVWIHDNSITYAGRNGIALTAATNALIERNRFDSLGLHVLDIEPDWDYQTTAHVTFRDNEAGTYGHSTEFFGFFFASNGAAGSSVSDVTVTGNTVTGNPSGGYDGSPRGLNTRVTTPRQAAITFSHNTSPLAAIGPVLTFANVDGVTVTDNRQPLISGSLASFSNCTDVVYP